MIWALLGKYGIAAGAIAAVIAGLVVWDYNRANRLRGEGAKKVVEDSRKAGAKRNDKVRKIRRTIKRDGAWDRLREKYGAGG